jgi:Amt family ammonium transporter
MSGSNIERYTAAAEEYNGADMAWVIVATVFCWAIIPGVGFLYSGYTNRRNALSPVWTGLMTMSVGSISWMTFGYSLTYGEGNAFIGDAQYLGHKGVLEVASGTIPALLFSMFQLTFSVATIAIFMGGAAERARLTSLIPIVFFWPLVVYSPIAHWTWTSKGWLAVLGAYDFAGGSPVHVASGAASMAMSMYLSNPLFRSRKSSKRALKVLVEHRPHNLLQLVISLVLIWNGWLAFDGCSTLALNLRSAVAMTTTQMSGSMGAITWSCWEYYKTGKWSIAAIASGAIAGLVAITPACGYVSLPSSLLFGVVGGTVCFWCSKFKHTRLAKKIGWIDPCDVTGAHWAGGVAGNILLGIFAEASIAATDGATDIPGGWLDGHWVQIGYQIADSVAATGYAFVVTYALVAIIDCVPGLEVLATDDDIIAGIDAADMGESFYDEQWAAEREWHPFLGLPSVGGKASDLESQDSGSGPSDGGQSPYSHPEDREKGITGATEVRAVPSP